MGLNVGMLGSLVGYYLLNMRGGKSEEMEREYMNIGDARDATIKGIINNPIYTPTVGTQTPESMDIPTDSYTTESTSNASKRINKHKKKLI